MLEFRNGLVTKCSLLGHRWSVLGYLLWKGDTGSLFSPLYVQSQADLTHTHTQNSTDLTQNYIVLIFYKPVTRLP
jgi:hypothetical protein